MLEFHMGWTTKMLITIRNISSAWSINLPLYGFFKGIESFCLEENGLLLQAIETAQIALAINQKDIYAIHTICHYFYEIGKFANGATWLEEQMPHWKDNKFMRIHIWWHYAIFKLYCMEIDQVYHIYQNEIRKKNNPSGLEDLDSVSLLWRIKLISQV